MQTTGDQERQQLRADHWAGGPEEGVAQPEQLAADASLRASLASALDRNKQLADESARLRRQLAHALGDQRSARTRSGNDLEE